MLKALWEPGESQYTVLRWMENAEDEGYTLLGETEVRTGRTGSRVTASREDVERGRGDGGLVPGFGILRGLLWV